MVGVHFHTETFKRFILSTLLYRENKSVQPKGSYNHIRPIWFRSGTNIVTWLLEKVEFVLGEHFLINIIIYFFIYFNDNSFSGRCCQISFLILRFQRVHDAVHLRIIHRQTASQILHHTEQWFWEILYYYSSLVSWQTQFASTGFLKSSKLASSDRSRLFISVNKVEEAFRKLYMFTFMWVG